MFEKMKEMIADQLGVEEEIVTMEASFKMILMQTLLTCLS